jgi:hypothetical protein
MVCAFFLMLGFLAELAIKASGMHGGGGRKVLVSGAAR